AARVTVAHLFSRSALAEVTPPRADRAFSTWATQWAHIMPSMFSVLVMVSVPPSFAWVLSSKSTGQLWVQGAQAGAVPLSSPAGPGTFSVCWDWGAWVRNLLLKKRRRKALVTTHTELR